MTTISGLAIVGCNEVIKWAVPEYGPSVVERVGRMFGDADFGPDLQGKWSVRYISPKFEGRDPDKPSDQVPNEQRAQTWTFKNKADAFQVTFVEVVDSKDEPVDWQSTGFLKDGTIVGSFRGRNINKGLYRLQHDDAKDYYAGYLLMCDCGAKNKPVMLCPMILFKPGGAARGKEIERDPFLSDDKTCVVPKVLN
ncbi:hypothetical protein [Pseudorhodoferax sp. Leaf274]|uniref:hypothetical protein n=1 Tax=Pseudorhodoferax sp. Leaf274 TaxID=1736318 RepID=UPI0012E32A04|nr:hypothetical protein [Pseudorhodoferax sp. Leaf274]